MIYCLNCRKPKAQHFRGAVGLVCVDESALQMPLGTRFHPESEEQRVNRILSDSRRKVAPRVAAEAEGENITAEIMEMRLRGAPDKKRP